MHDLQQKMKKLSNRTASKKHVNTETIQIPNQNRINTSNCQLKIFLIFNFI